MDWCFVRPYNVLFTFFLCLGRTEVIPTCYLKETSMLHPDVKHSWLCDGKLLRLLETQNKNNFELFKQRWTLGMLEFREQTTTV